MELDNKNMGDQDMRQLDKSLELVSARELDYIVRAGQLASSATPEMQTLFNEWVNCLGGELTRAVEESGGIDPEALAAAIGVAPSAIISLALTLHRQGAIKITEIKAEPSSGKNTEICGCLQNN